MKPVKVAFCRSFVLWHGRVNVRNTNKKTNGEFVALWCFLPIYEKSTFNVFLFRVAGR